jgi:hypothetical protein
MIHVPRTPYNCGTQAIGPRQIHTEVRWRVGAGHAAALRAMAKALAGDLGEACTDGHSDVTAALRSFLVCRVLGVIDLRLLDATDSMHYLSRLAQILDRSENDDR